MRTRIRLRRKQAVIATVAAAALTALLTVGAGLVGAAGNAPSGAIFTTLPDGSEVNFNIYPSKDLVYLDGGPGPGAPVDAAGLDDGTYVFQVTDPSGKTLGENEHTSCTTTAIVSPKRAKGSCATLDTTGPTMSPLPPCGDLSLRHDLSTGRR